MSEPCTVCGLPLNVGDYPCVLTPRPHQRGSGYRGHDEIPGGLWVENLGPEPIKFYSQSAIDKYAKSINHVRVVKHVPASPESDYSPHTTNWGRMTDPYTLEAARILVSRSGQAKSSDAPVVLESLKMDVRTLDA